MGDKALVGCHPWHEQAPVEALAVLVGVTGTDGWAEEYTSPCSPHSPPKTLLLYLPKTFPPPPRTHSLVHTWLHAIFLVPS